MTSIKLPIVTSTQILKYILFIIFLVIGVNSFGDFGIYGDEPIHRWIGSIYYLHIMNKNCKLKNITVATEKKYWLL